ncbi:MAG TPA: hypothetical protein VF009_06925 [Solirubrobacterales bacterium]
MSAAAPAPGTLDTIRDLAVALESTWPSREEVAATDPLGLTAMAEEGEVQEQPTDSPEPGAEVGGDQPGGEEPEAFTDAYNPDDLPDEVRPVYEAAYKRLQSDYTKKRQTDAEQVREAQAAQRIVEGLQDPQRAPAILQALEVPTGEEDEFDLSEFEEPDPNERINLLEAQLAQQAEMSQQQAAVQAENRYVGEQIAALEDELDVEFTDDEIGLLYMYADEYRDENNAPDVKAAHRVLDAIATTAQQRLVKGKAGAPRRMGQGTAARTKVDLKDPNQRLKAMEEAADATRASAE